MRPSPRCAANYVRTSVCWPASMTFMSSRLRNVPVVFDLLSLHVRVLASIKTALAAQPLCPGPPLKMHWRRECWTRPSMACRLMVSNAPTPSTDRMVASGRDSVATRRAWATASVPGGQGKLKRLARVQEPCCKALSQGASHQTPQEVTNHDPPDGFLKGNHAPQAKGRCLA